MLLTFGWTLAATLAVGSIVGAWLDHRWKSSPLFLVLGVAAGTAAAAFQLRSLIRTLDRIDREQAENPSAQPPEPPPGS